MRAETNDWLLPMIEEADRRSLEIAPFLYAASMPAAEAATAWGDWLAALGPADGMRAVEWVRFGRLLRHELGWDDTYPDHPDTLSK